MVQYIAALLYGIKLSESNSHHSFSVQLGMLLWGCRLHRDPAKRSKTRGSSLALSGSPIDDWTNWLSDDDSKGTTATTHQALRREAPIKAQQHHMTTSLHSKKCRKIATRLPMPQWFQFYSVVGKAELGPVSRLHYGKAMQGSIMVERFSLVSATMSAYSMSP